MRMDMHIHSHYSDGTFSPEEIVIKAREIGLDLIALTDHNTFSGIPEFLESAKRHNQNAVAGIELTTEFEGTEIHLLSYFPSDCDVFSDRLTPLRNALDDYHVKKREQTRRIVENLSVDFPQVTYDGFIEYIMGSRDNDNLNRVHIGNFLVHLGLVDSVKGAFTSLLSRKEKYYVGMERPDIVETARLVHRCGGIPVVAHMVQYKRLDDKEKGRLLRSIHEAVPVFGAELFHNDHSEEFVRFYKEMCERVEPDILFTAGSDFHGTNKTNEIGRPFTFEPDKEIVGLYEGISDRMYGTLFGL